MHANLLIFAPFVILLAMAAVWDLTTYTIPNFIPAVILLAFAVFGIAAGYGLTGYGWHLLAGFVALAAGFILFALGYIGGGDAKLFAAAATWFGMRDLPEYVVVASLFGGALTIALLAMRQWPLPAGMVGRKWVTNLHDQKAGIPYGVALAAGAIAILPYTEIAHAFAR